MSERNKTTASQHSSPKVIICPKIYFESLTRHYMCIIANLNRIAVFEELGVKTCCQMPTLNCDKIISRQINIVPK